MHVDAAVDRQACRVVNSRYGAPQRDGASIEIEVQLEQVASF